MNSSWMLPAVTECTSNMGTITNNGPKQVEDNHHDPYASMLNVLICSVALSVLSNKTEEEQHRANQNTKAIEQQVNLMNSLMNNKHNAAPEVDTSQDANDALISAILRQHTQTPSNSAPQGILQLPSNLLLSALGNNGILGPICSTSTVMPLKSTSLCQDVPDEPVRSISQEQSPALPSTSKKRQKGRPAIFIKALYEMLHALEKEPDGKKIASFLPGGDTFAVHKPETLVNTVLPKYFRMKSMSSFKRQLNMYGFRQVSVGSEKCAYYHELFMHGQPKLLKNIQRVKKNSLAIQIEACVCV